MKRNNNERVGDVVRQVLRENGLETPLNQFRLINAWTDIMGEGIAAYTGNIFIKNQTLFVKIKSSVLRSELMMSRTALVKRLNETVGAQVVTDIMFV